jgi:hypothetical protein
MLACFRIARTERFCYRKEAGEPSWIVPFDFAGEFGQFSTCTSSLVLVPFLLADVYTLRVNCTPRLQIQSQLIACHDPQIQPIDYYVEPG